MKFVMLENFRDNNGDFTSDIFCSHCLKQSEVYVEIQSDSGKPLLKLCKTCLDGFINDINNSIIQECKNKVTRRE